ncbi:scavenger receptor cysteine-rich type 1 protein M130-like isoform X2 [Erpetoichthys calabaricus]|uniref:scavenger receptor cysteine-rich type 1 protein M130-like isoform X2 n=1 Tax=Erpetoichthys calabaricus TaxID=27687 RepID=UPI0022343CD5|nr:scavenger receptor cysteine-rich type 1 protein M130-like isoform X2 [Erpetoichthys calabaricus]
MAAMLSLLLVGLMASLSTAVDANGQVRLVNGINRCSGRVELFYQGQWGTVSDDGWDLNDAEVVCRQLGCGNAFSAPGNAHFGKGSGKIWMDGVACKGNELSLMLCKHNGMGEHNCDSHEDAGVVCSGRCNIQYLCQKGWENHSSQCYQFFTEKKSWIDAELYCVRLGGNLASVHSSGDHHFITSLIKRSDSHQPTTWLGGFDCVRTLSWLWTDGSQWDFTNWNPGEPNNDRGIENCLHTNYLVPGGWNDIECEHQFPFVCMINDWPMLYNKKE